MDDLEDDDDDWGKQPDTPPQVRNQKSANATGMSIGLLGTRTSVVETNSGVIVANVSAARVGKVMAGLSTNTVRPTVSTAGPKVLRTDTGMTEANISVACGWDKSRHSWNQYCRYGDQF